MLLFNARGETREKDDVSEGIVSRQCLDISQLVQAAGPSL